MRSLTRLAVNDVWARAGVTPRHRTPENPVRPWDVDRDRHGRIEACDVGRLRLAKIRANPMCIEQTRPPETASELDLYKVLLQVSGRSLLNQSGREILLSAGDWTLYRSAVPFALWNLERCEHRMVILPRKELWGGTIDLEAHTVRRFGQHDRSSRQLVTLLDNAFELASVFGTAAATELAGAAVHLSRLALLETTGIGLQRVRADVIRSRVQSFIDRNLRDRILACLFPQSPRR
jgi:hypothetical protein